MCQRRRCGMGASVRVCWRWKNSLIWAARCVSTCTRDSPRSPTPSCRISRICSGAAFLVTAMSVTSLGSRLAFLQAAAIRSFTSLNLSESGDRLATRYSFVNADYKEPPSAGIVRAMGPEAEKFRRAIQRFDEANAEDPHGQELIYAQRMSEWLGRIEPNASEALRLAARSQHIRRWEIPRSKY